MKTETERNGCQLTYLDDGRVIGIDAESIVLYPSIDDYYEGTNQDKWEFIDLRADDYKCRNGLPIGECKCC